ncbi:hypothetical protein Tco_0057267, partial [Tanacetum coccineum]
NTPCFEENSGQSYTCSDEVTKELKDIGFKGVHVIDSDVADGYGGENLPQTNTILKNLNSKDIGTCIGASKSAYNQDQRSTTWTGNQSHMPEKDVPSHGLLRGFIVIYRYDKKEEHGIKGSFTINQDETGISCSNILSFLLTNMPKEQFKGDFVILELLTATFWSNTLRTRFVSAFFLLPFVLGGIVPEAIA